jgi:hypothetical protein|nr:hypothetical protein [Neorhizobium tomejilense]
MSDENEWSISFDPRTDEDLDTGVMKQLLAPYVLSVKKKSPHRYELLLDDELSESPQMGEVITNVILLLGEHYPDGLVVGHLENEPEAEDDEG